MPILALIDEYTGHSLHVDRIRDYTERRPMQPTEIARIAAQATVELHWAIDDDDVDGIIAAERRLVAVGALAQANANTLELGRRS